jgi:hypothetical protein
LGNLPSAILWTWPYHVSWFCSISFIIVSSSPVCCFILTFLILSFLDILEDLLRAVAYPGIFFGGVQQIQLRTEDRENGDLGVVAP